MADTTTLMTLTSFGTTITGCAERAGVAGGIRTHGRHYHAYDTSFRTTSTGRAGRAGVAGGIRTHAWQTLPRL